MRIHNSHPDKMWCPLYRRYGRVNKAAREWFGAELSPDIFDGGDFWLIAIPALMAHPARKTVGPGDVISSTAFVFDPF